MREGMCIHAIRILACVISCVGAPLSANGATVTGKHAAFVVDANSGEVLHADRATALRYPASLTKMMTLYILFENIEDRRLSYDTKITTSAYAASRPPSQLGLKVGDRITVRQAVHALVTKSANDVATAIAEHIGKTEAGFARLMTRKARQLGMNRTVFRNASGLPNASQVTTARDMAQLALRLRDHFPRHYKQFKTRVFRYKGRRYRNHNSLLGRYPGVDGIKTGYTRASGFNLVTSLRKNNRDVVAVVMGGKSGRARNATMRRLLAKHVPSATVTRTRRPAIRVALRRPPKQLQRRASRRTRQRPAPRLSRPVVKRTYRRRPVARPLVPKPVRRSPNNQPTIQIARVRPVNILRRQSSPRLPARPAREGATDRAWTTQTRQPQSNTTRGLQPGTLQGQAARINATGNRQALQQTPLVARFAAPRNALGGRETHNNIHIQVGAYRTPTEAHRQLENVSVKASALLTGARPLAVRAISGNREIYRARFAGFAANTATSTCNRMRRLGIDCFVTRAQ